MNTVVIYKSKSGFTKEYAQWIAEELKCDIMEHKGLKLGDIQGYDTIIYGGGIYASGLAGIKLITGNYEALKNKNIIVWASGFGPDNTEELAKMWDKNFTDEQRAKIKMFYLRGGFDYNKLGMIDKGLMKAFKAMLEKEKNPPEGMEGFLKSFYEPQDYRSKDNIRELVKYARSLE